MYVWRTDNDGIVHVRDDGGEEFTPTLTDPKQIALLEHGLARFGDLFRERGGYHGIVPEWLAAHAYRESGFNPRALLIEKHADGSPRFIDGRMLTGVGLFQPTHPSVKGKWSDEQLYDPVINTNVACQHLRNLMQRAECQKGPRADFVRVSAAYNAGSVRKPADDAHKNKWDLHCTRGHIDAEVSALNYALLRSKDAQTRAALNAVGVQFDLRDIVDDDGRERPGDALRA